MSHRHGPSHARRARGIGSCCCNSARVCFLPLLLLPPKLSDYVRLEIGAARQASRAPRTAQCQCGVFPACPHADAVTGVSGVVWVDSDLRTTAIQLEGHKPSRQLDCCVRRAHAAAARRLLGSTSSTKSRVSLSVAVHLPAPVHSIADRNYTGIGPFSQAWMDQHVLADERRFFDRVDFRGMKSADQQPALWIPNLDRRDWVVGGATTPAAAKKALAFAADVDTRARTRAAAELTTALVSPRRWTLLSTARGCGCQGCSRSWLTVDFATVSASMSGTTGACSREM